MRQANRIGRGSAGAILVMALGAGTVGGCAETEPAERKQAINRRNIVTEWATITADAILRPVESSTAFRTPAQSVTLHAQVQLAVYDALVGFENEYQPFSIDVDVPRGADEDAAIATAAYRVLRARVPGRADFLDRHYAETMAKIDPGDSREDGVAVGEEVAAHYLALRAGDGPLAAGGHDRAAAGERCREHHDQAERSAEHAM